MAENTRGEPSRIFEALNKSALAVNQAVAGAGVLGLIGFIGLFILAAVFFITENFFVGMLILSIALLVYVTGAEVAKLVMSSLTIFFSSKHLTAKAAQLQETLVALEERLSLRRDRNGELRAGTFDAGQKIRLPDNVLVRDIKDVLEHGKDFNYAEYVAHSYYVECHELYDHSAAHLEFVANAMPLFGLIGTVTGLIGMFDSLGSVVTVEALSPQFALALKTTLYGAVFATVYKLMSTRFEQRLKALDYDFETFCRALQVLIDNKIGVEVQK
jgi:biopolymer transport protein ExbB/TolQ